MNITDRSKALEKWDAKDGDLGIFCIQMARIVGFDEITWRKKFFILVAPYNIWRDLNLPMPRPYHWSIKSRWDPGMMIF